MTLLTDRLRHAIKNSRVLAALPQAIHSSGVIEGGRKTLSQARTVALARTLADDIEPLTRSSWVGRSVGGLTDRVGRYHDRSLVHSVAETGVDWIEGSWGYRWLTAEPDSDVTVIDLRNTLLIGPVIAVLDAVLESLLPAFDYSVLNWTTDRATDMLQATPIKTISFVVLIVTTMLIPPAVIATDGSPPIIIAYVGVALIAALGTRVKTSWDEIAETRAIQAIAAFFEPPSLEQDSEHNAMADTSLTMDQRTSETEPED